MTVAAPEETTALGQSRLLLMVWLSPMFPVGAFAYSHGLEQVHADGHLRTADALECWLRAMLEHGSLRNDLILICLTQRAAARSDAATVVALGELAVALATCSERRLETTGQGAAFLSAALGAWGNAELRFWAEQLAAQPTALPSAFAVAVAAHRIPLREALEAYALAWLSNLVSATTRLGAIGQSDAQRTLAALLPRLPAAAQHALQAGEDDLGSCTLTAEIAAMRHESLYCRLFRS